LAQVAQEFQVALPITAAILFSQQLQVQAEAAAQVILGPRRTMAYQVDRAAVQVAQQVTGAPVVQHLQLIKALQVVQFQVRQQVQMQRAAEVAAVQVRLVIQRAQQKPAEAVALAQQHLLQVLQ
jgi:hypothetical protein